MRKSIIPILLILFLTLTANAQNASKFNVKSDGTKVLTSATDINKSYRITIEGTYSMWPQYSDCHGADATYVYDVPIEEINAYRWPPDTINIAGLKFPFVNLPHWVGDEKNWAFPPKEIGTPIFELSFRKYIGFRIDGEPLPNTGIDKAVHRYQIEKIGTGKPFEFQILDSNYSILQDKVNPRYDDNCGSLAITIEIIPDEDINICDIKPICKDNKYIGLQLWASIFAKDTTLLSGRKNILNNLSSNQIGIVENGVFRCDIDSIVCNSRKRPMSFALVIDRSPSMEEPISNNDQTVRLTAAKNAINRFIDNLNSSDSAFVVSFAQDVSLDQDWTNDKSKLKSAVDKLTTSNATQLYGAIMQAAEKTSMSNNPKRAIIVLSDGGNTWPPYWSSFLQNYIQSKNIPIYIVALGLKPEDQLGKDTMYLIANSTRGKLYEANNALSLDTVYQNLSKEIAEDECCAIYFKVAPCDSKEDKYIRLIYSPSDTTILTKVVKYKCDSCDKVTSVEEKQSEPNDLGGILFPNPTAEYINLIANYEGTADATIINSLGSICMETKVILPNFTITDLNTLPIGSYTIILKHKNKTILRKMFVKFEK